MDEPPTSFRTLNMPGFDSPCGACKFLRRKCSRCCIFAPYLCNEQGSAHFAAIHKVFGASNVSKLLMHLPIPDRGDATVTITYEAQARLQDPIHGCVAHIFVVQQQVLNLKAQLAFLKAQASQSLVNIEPLTIEEHKPYTKFTSYQHGEQGFFHDERMLEPLLPPPSIHASSQYENGLHNSNRIQLTDQSFSNADSSMIGIRDNMEELMSVAYAYFHRV